MPGPLPINVHEVYQRMHRLWSWTLLSPIIYLFVARGMIALGWVETFPQARHPWDNALGRTVVILIVLGMFGGIVWLRLRRQSLIREHSDDLPQALRRWTWNFYLMASLADALAFVGLAYFIMSGRLWSILVGGALTYLGYALAYPARRDLNSLASPRGTGRRMA